MVNIKHYRVYLDRSKFDTAMDDMNLTITKLASQLYISTNTIHYRMHHGWKRMDAEIVARFLKVKVSDLTI